MSRRRFLRPDRRMLVPFLAVASSVCWFVLRDVRGSRSLTDRFPVYLAGLVVAIAVGYAVGAAFVAFLGPADASEARWTRPLVAPSNATIAVVAVAFALLAGFFVVDVWFGSPGWLSTASTLLAPLVGWPAFVAVFASYALGNALGGGLPFVVEAAFVAAGIGLSVAWLFLLSAGIARTIAIQRPG